MNYYFITGASRGIGKALAAQLLEEAHHVIGFSRSKALQHDRYQHFSVDFSDNEALQEKVSGFFNISGQVDKIVLINNAGTLGEVAYMGNLSNKEIANLFNINVTAPAILMNEFIKSFKDIKAVKLIINISSGAANRPVDGWSGYCSSKAALNMLSEVAAKEDEMAGGGFKIYALSPGVVDTDMQDQIRTTANENFSDVKKFIALKEEHQLADPVSVAQKIIRFMENYSDFPQVIQDLRNI